MVSETITDRQFEIIEAAGKILTNSGVSGLTIKNLAKAMQFSESAIYRHFVSKEQIVIAMLDYLANNMDKRFTKGLNHALGSQERFLAIFENQFSFFKNNPHFVVAVFSDGLMEESQSINEAILRIMAIKTKHLKPIIVQGQLENVFRNDISTEDLIHIILGTMRLQMYKWQISKFQFDIVQNGNKIIHSLLTTIKSQPR